MLMRITFALALCAFASETSAQPNCKKGIPCGNSCISASNTCRIGTRPEPKPSAEPPPTPASAQGLRASGYPANSYATGPWVASVDGTVYYRRECSTASKLMEDERVYFL